MSQRFMAGLLQGIQKSEDRYTTLRANRDANARAKESHELNKQKQKLQIKELEQSGKMSASIQSMIDIQNAESKLQDTKFKANDMQLNDNINKTQDALGTMGRTKQKYEAFLGRSGKPQLREVKPQTFNDAKNVLFQKAEAGEIRYEDIRKKFPSKAKEISTAHLGSMSQPSQNVIEQLKGSIKENASEMSATEVTKQLLTDLVEREEEATKMGVDVDSLLDYLDVTREMLKGDSTKKDNWLQRIIKKLES